MLGLSNNLASGGFVDTFANLKSLIFDGSDEYLNCGDDTSLDITDDITMMAWVKPASAGQNAHIIGRDDGTNRNYVLYVNSNIYIFDYFVSDTAQRVASTTADTANVWVHLACTRDKTTGKNIIYVNGVAEDTDTDSTAAIDNDDVQFSIGARDIGTSPFSGNIDEVSIWNTALSANAVSQIYANGKGIDLRSNSGDYTSASSLVGYWRCGDGKLGADADGTNDVIFDMDNASLGDNPSGYSSLNFDSADWADVNISSCTSNTFTTSSSGGKYADSSNTKQVIGTTYKCTLDATTTATSGFRVWNGGGTGEIYLTHASTSNYSDSFYFTAPRVDIYILNLSAGTMTVNSISVKEVNGNPAVMVNAESEDIQTEVPKQVKGLPAVSNTYSLEFDGTDDYVDCGGDIDITGAFTISAWINTDTIGTALRCIACQGSSYFGLDDGAGGILLYQGQGTSGNNLKTQTPLVIDTWYHIVLSVAGTDAGDGKIYIDGVRDDDNATTVFMAAGDFQIGKMPTADSRYWDGNIDGVAIWNTALDGDSIRAIYNNGVPTNLKNNTGAYDEYTDNLVAYYRCGDGTLDDYPLIGDEVTPTLGSESLGTDDDDWTLASGLSISEGTITFDDSGNLDADYDGSETGTFTFTTDKLYKFVFTTSGDDPQMQMRDSNGNELFATASYATGTHTLYYKAVSDNNANRLVIRCQSAGSSFDISNISLKQVNGNAGILTNMSESDIAEDTP